LLKLMLFELSGIEANPILIFLWAVVVGFVFSSVGAAGGILAGVGHISILGIGNANMIKVMNQLMVSLSSIISILNYVRMRRIVLTLGVFLGLGSVTGAITGAWFSKNYLPTLGGYKFYFGLIVFIIAARIFYELTPRYVKANKSTASASARFERHIRGLKHREKGSDVKSHGVETSSISYDRVIFSFFSEEFSFNPLTTFCAGFVIAAISAAIGVGGGFLYVPFLTSVVGLPMFIVAGTSALAVIISMLTSIITYLHLGVIVDWPLLGIELAGIAFGSVLGPKASNYYKERWLKAFLAIILLLIGLRYMGILD